MVWGTERRRRTGGGKAKIDKREKTKETVGEMKKKLGKK